MKSHALQGCIIAFASLAPLVACSDEAGSLGVACGGGTFEYLGFCYPDSPTLDYTDGGDAGEMFPSDAATEATAQIGDGSRESACGFGTTLDPLANICRPNLAPGESYEIRPDRSSAMANGYSSVRLNIFGALADGGLSTEAVILGVSNTWAGSLSPSVTSLSPIGSTNVIFSPCNAAAAPSCAGPVYLTLARASAPSIILAKSNPIELVAPKPVSGIDKCPKGATALRVHGEAVNDVGVVDLAPSENLDTRYDATGSPYVSMSFPGWKFLFSSPGHLDPGVYDDASYNAPSGNPALSITKGSSTSCRGVGRFQVHEFSFDNNKLRSFAVSFESACNPTSAAPLVTGCFRYEGGL